MSKTVTVTKWGNAQGIRLPDVFCRQLGIAAGDKVTIAVEKNRMIVTNLDEQYAIEARLAAWDGSGSPEPEYDWGKPAGKEIW
jgi:antitoxin component of MazEF toxin-antitoxin module